MMKDDARYQHALSAALVILNELDGDKPKHERLAVVIFSILHAMRSYEEENRREHEFSAN